MLLRIAEKTGAPLVRVVILGWILAATLVLGALALWLNGWPVIVGVVPFVLGAVTTMSVASTLMRLKEDRRAQRDAPGHSGG